MGQRQRKLTKRVPERALCFCSLLWGPLAPIPLDREASAPRFRMLLSAPMGQTPLEPLLDGKTDIQPSFGSLTARELHFLEQTIAYHGVKPRKSNSSARQVPRYLPYALYPIPRSFNKTIARGDVTGPIAVGHAVSVHLFRSIFRTRRSPACLRLLLPFSRLGMRPLKCKWKGNASCSIHADP